MHKPRLRPLLIVATMATAMAALATPGMADEIDDLKRQIKLLTQRIESIEEKQKQSESDLKKIAANNTPVPELPSNTVLSLSENVKLAITGQVNRAVLYADDGADSDLFHVDNDNSSTRVRFTGMGRFNDDITVGTQFEVQFESNSSSDIEMDESGNVSPNNFTKRKLELYFDSKKLGKLWLGQGDTASNHTARVDVSGTYVIAGSAVEKLAGGLYFRDTDSGASIVRIKNAYNEFDGLSREDRLRYDAPGFRGLQASGSLIQGGAWDVALRYAVDLKPIDTRIAAAAAYADGGGEFGYNQYNGSMSALHASGISLTLAAGKRDFDDGNSKNAVTYYGKLGYQFEPFDFGRTAFSIDYGRSADLAAEGDEFESWGLFMVQRVDKIATELYVGYRNHDLDRPGRSIEDIDVGVAGARIKF